MLNRIRHIASGLLAAYYLLAFIGVSWHTHYCGMTGQTFASILPVNCEHATAGKNAPCHEASCCMAEQPSEHGDCADDVQYVSAELSKHFAPDLHVSFPTLKALADGRDACLIWQPAALSSPFGLCIAPEANAPPLPFGRDLIARVQSFLL